MKKSRLVWRDFFVCMLFRFFLKKFQLLPRGIGCDFFLADEEFYFRELFVGDGEAAYLTILRQRGFDSFEVDCSVLSTGTVAHIDGKLEHRETIAQQLFAEVGGGLAFLFCLGGEVEEDEQPHDAVFAEAVHGYSSG